tara:strand:- start:855 stop:1286 length:432 start_codon:yes stop_codon:yes gene_type:complete
MGQRVNIQYSVDIGDLEGEVNRLLLKAHERIDKLSSAAPPDTRTLSVESIDHIENLRAEMAQIDYSLSDLNKIITGYLAYRTSDTSNEQYPSPPPVDNSTSLDELQEALLRAKDGSQDSMEKALEKFRDTVAPGDSARAKNHI